MRISTKGRYRLRLMTDLAINYGKKHVTLKEISKRQAISEKYLWHLVPPLKSAGLMSTGRGAHGGYSLAKPPAKITLKQIVTALEGPLCPVECVGNPALCKRARMCASRDVWREIGKKIEDTLEGITLEDMAERQLDKLKGAESGASMYYI
jgi:Rrf2 family protein